MVNIEHVKFGALSGILVLATIISATVDENHSIIFAQNSNSTLDNGGNVGGIDPGSEPKDELIASGNIAQDQGNYTEAIEYYDKVLAIDPNDVDALNNKEVALNSGNNNEAIVPAHKPSDSDNDSSSGDGDSNDSNNESSGSSGSDNAENNDDGDDSDSKQDKSSNEDEDETEDEFEKTNPLRDQIRNKVNEALSASGIAVP